MVLIRLAKFYSRKDGNGNDLTEHAQQQIITEVYQAVNRRAAGLCNFVGTSLVYFFLFLFPHDSL